jgi:hypothetical protein
VVVVADGALAVHFDIAQGHAAVAVAAGIYKWLYV